MRKLPPTNPSSPFTDQRLQFRSIQPELGLLPRNMYLQQHIHHHPLQPRLPVNLSQQPQTVYPMDQVDKRDNRLYLIALQMPDKMPPNIPRKLTRFIDQLLHIIFPEVPLPHLIQRKDIRCRLRFGNRNQLNTPSQPVQYAPISIDCYSHVKIAQREDTYTSGTLYY